MASRVAFVGYKQVDGFLTVDTAEREYRAHMARLAALGEAFTTEQFGDDYMVVYVVETCLKLQKGDD